MTDTSSGRWISINEAVTYFNRSERTIRRWIKINKIQSKREKKRIYILVPNDQIDTNRQLSDASDNIDKLQAELEKLQAINEILSGNLTDAKEDRDYWRNQAGALTALVENQRKQIEATTSLQRPWWKFWEDKK